MEEFVNVDSNFLCFLSPFYPAAKAFLKTPTCEWLTTFQAGRRDNNFIFANCRRPLKFPSDSVDHILISHFLEHLHYEDAVAVLASYFAALKPGGTLHIIVPDLAENARDYVNQIGDPAATESFVDWLNYRKRHMTKLSVRVLRLTGWFDLGHCFLYDVSLLSKLVRSAGFELLTHNDSPSAFWRLNDPRQVNILVQKPVR